MAEEFAVILEMPSFFSSGFGKLQARIANLIHDFSVDRNKKSLRRRKTNCIRM